MSGGPIGQVVVVPNHHEGYITPDEFEENQRILAMNRNLPGKPGRREGCALVQGLVCCGDHEEHVMSPHYSPKSPKSYLLHCMGEVLVGGRSCISLSGRALEPAIVTHALAHIVPPHIAEVRRQWERYRTETRRGTTSRARILQQARDQYERLRSLFYSCDPSHVRTRYKLERDVEEQAKEVERLEREAREAEPLDPFTDARWEELVRLSTDVTTIWDAATTTVMDKKELLRTIVSNVVIDVKNAERITGRIRWEDGTAETPFEVLRPAYWHRRIWELHLAGISPNEMARMLDAEGATTQQGNPWSVPTILKTIRILAKRRQRTT